MSVSSMKKSAKKKAQGARKKHAELRRRATAVGLDMPPPALCGRIAEATHQVVTEAYGDGAIDVCSAYAFVGAICASVLTGHTYAVQAGSLYVPVDSGPHPLQLAFDATDPRTQGYEFHAWFARRHEGGRGEVVDLASRHYFALARRFGMSPTVPEPPAYIWAPHDNIPAGVRLVADTWTTATVNQSFQARASVLGQLARRAVDIASGKSALTPLPNPRDNVIIRGGTTNRPAI